VRYQVILGDYLSVILGLIRKGNTWSLNPFDVSVYLICRIFWLNYCRKFVRMITHYLSVERATLLVARCVWQHFDILINNSDGP